jgi:hypothetical protein
LTVAALTPAGLFWAMVLAGSFHGLIAFGRSVLGCNPRFGVRWLTWRSGRAGRGAGAAVGCRGSVDGARAARAVEAGKGGGVMSRGLLECGCRRRP